MLNKLLHWAISALLLMLTAYLLPGISITSFSAALIGSFAIGFVNILIKPLVLLLTLPVTILTLGLFTLVINALMFSLAAWFVPGFEVGNFFSAFFGAILLAILNALFNRENKSKGKSRR